jgi:hypothetical protein
VYTAGHVKSNPGESGAAPTCPGAVLKALGGQDASTILDLRGPGHTSEAMSSRPRHWRFFSFSMSALTSGSHSERDWQPQGNIGFDIVLWFRFAILARATEDTCPAQRLKALYCIFVLYRHINTHSTTRLARFYTGKLLNVRST